MAMSDSLNECNALLGSVESMLVQRQKRQDGEVRKALKEWDDHLTKRAERSRNECLALIRSAEGQVCSRMPFLLRGLSEVSSRFAGIPVRPDPWTILGLERNEPRFTRLLGHLFDPAGEHGLGDLPLRRLLAAVDLPLVRALLARPGSLEATVNTEVSFGCWGRPDIVIVCDSLVVIVEVKIDAQVHPIDVKQEQEDALKALVPPVHVYSIEGGGKVLDQTAAYRAALSLKPWPEDLVACVSGSREGFEIAFVLLAPEGARATTDDPAYVSVLVSSLLSPVLAGLDESGGQGAAGWWQRAILTMLLALCRRGGRDGLEMLIGIRRVLATACVNEDVKRGPDARTRSRETDRRLAVQLSMMAAELLSEWDDTVHMGRRS